MKTELLFAIPTLVVLIAICVAKRATLKVKREKEWERTKQQYKYKDWRY